MPQLYRLARRLITVRREQQLRWLFSRFVPVRHRSCAENVYHCCVWKTASQWIRNVLSTSAVYRYSGLLPYSYGHHEGRDDRPLQERSFDHAFPKRCIVTPLYINYESFAALPKPARYRAFFVMRDPRDTIVSHYFSSRYSHVENPGVLEERARIDDLPEKEGMAVHMRYMAERGIFEALESWAQQGQSNPNAKLFRFEDLVGADQMQWMTQLMEHCDIQLPEHDLRRILGQLSFSRLSGGRNVGEEDQRHKYRSGKPGDWRKYFDDSLTTLFAEVTGDLLGTLGYE